MTTPSLTPAQKLASTSEPGSTNISDAFRETTPEAGFTGDRPVDDPTGTPEPADGTSAPESAAAALLEAATEPGSTNTPEAPRKTAPEAGFTGDRPVDDPTGTPEPAHGTGAPESAAAALLETATGAGSTNTPEAPRKTAPEAGFTGDRPVDDPTGTPEPAHGTGAPESAAAALLEAAAVALTCRRAGVEPVSGLEPMAEAPAETVAPLPAAASARLARILGGGVPGGGHHEQELLAQWLAAAAARGGIVPPAILPALLEAGRRNTAVRADLATVAGRRGVWLAGQRDDWRWLLSEVPPALAGDGAPDWLGRLAGEWATAGTAERLGHLAALRAVDPDQARELVESTWAEESSENRARFLSAFGPGLSLRDEPLLERALDDRRKEVREAALDLLRNLPGAALGRRMAERAHAAVQLGDSGRLTVEPPAELDRDLRRDGVGAAPVRGIGAGAWLLEEVVAGTPLDTWTALDPEGWLTAARGHDWAAPLLHGWAKAAVVQRDARWATALLGSAAGLLREAVRWDLHLVLPSDRLARLAAEALRAEDGTAQRLLALHPGPWPDGLSVAVLETVEQRARTDRHTWQLGELCRAAGLAMPPEYADLAGRLAALLDQTVDPTRVRPVAELARTLTFRLEMFQELS